MSNQEYDQKRRECWKEYCRTHPLCDTPVMRLNFDWIFDRAYALGREKETITQEEIERASQEYSERLGKNRDVTWNDAQYGFIAGASFALGKHEKDAEGEEMLTVSRKRVQEMYAANERIKADFPENETGRISDHINHVLHYFFGSMCLPNEKPTCTQTCTDDCPSQEKSQNDRLKIAAMAMQAIITRADMVRWANESADECYGKKVCSTYRAVAKAALAFAEDLIAEAESPFEPEATDEKGGDK